MIHPDVELRFMNERIGYGVVATRRIPAGTIVWVRDELDQVFSPERVAAMKPPMRAVLDVWGYVIATGDTVLCWDHGRFVNHSCLPSAIAPGYEFDLAVTDIEPGEQITNDYASLNLVEGFTCRCGLAACRGWIDPDSFLVHADRWDEVVARAFPLIPTVSQPLWDLVAEQDEVNAVLGAAAAPASCRVHRLGGAAEVNVDGPKGAGRGQPRRPSASLGS